MTTPITVGMTRTEVIQQLGYPYEITSYALSGVRYETFWYRHDYAVHTMLGPASEYVQVRGIQLRNGIVTGTISHR